MTCAQHRHPRAGWLEGAGVRVTRPRQPSDLAERDRMKKAFYEGELWKNELEAIAMPMLESYDVSLCQTSPGCLFDMPQAEPAT